ncbi:hypothetical protein DM82_4141 [Burkholderia oklahomensis]|uniref:Efflux system membrane protein n=1 Tax=Burkholderia oklahomensis TaxID=342113 RepID=A0AAI8FRH8_9BURK|nr:hypothetical protein DM82_4141 [Burkholderia oklahomensis]AJX34930.1 hypothetical protein BG90_3885 [Burkholderia oklahomensis C6786]SUY28705.1 efflux system membrane protein [Burkholderia oklahomensis]
MAGIYLPPFFVYACVAVPLYMAVRAALARAGLLRRVWHPALFEFAVSLVLVAALVLYL